MDVIGTIAAFRAATDATRAAGRTVGLVPTMGFFHEGHLSLMRRARAERDVAAVSVFVNPLQFGPDEDFAAYPRDLDRDLAFAEAAGIDLVFAPPEAEMYPDGAPRVTVDPGPLADRYEGALRPGHFRGVLTVVAKLLHATGPCAAYFGEKDAQQLALIRRMAADLSFPVVVTGCPIIREQDGLAMSSRNVYLSPEERAAAGSLSRGLRAAREAMRGGERDSAALAAAIRAEVEREPLASLDYAAVVDDVTFDEVDRVDRPARALVAARVGKPRLIDNLLLEP
ncbi:MAG TPA: pantoate--beta-alanine ligase [Actinomycetota bacterium]